MQADFYGRGGFKFKMVQAKLAVRKEDLLSAVNILEECMMLARQAGSHVDAEFCEEALQTIKLSTEYVLQRNKVENEYKIHEEKKKKKAV